MGMGSTKNGAGKSFTLRQCGFWIPDIEKLLLELGIVLLMVHLCLQNEEMQKTIKILESRPLWLWRTEKASARFGKYEEVDWLKRELNILYDKEEKMWQ